MSDKGATGLFGQGRGNRLPQNDAQLMHIFREDNGHLPDTPRNRQLLLGLVNDQRNFYGTDMYGNDWYIEVDSQGRQLWGQTRNGIIREGGRDGTPLDWKKVQDSAETLSENGDSPMKVNAYLAFVAMFYALDAVWNDGVKTDELRSYLSDINPFIWKGECSADPANYIEFKETYESRLGEGVSNQDTYDFVKEYLNRINPEFSNLFCLAVNKAEWENGLTELESQLKEHHWDLSPSAENTTRCSRNEH